MRYRRITFNVRILKTGRPADLVKRQFDHIVLSIVVSYITVAPQEIGTG